MQQHQLAAFGGVPPVVNNRSAKRHVLPNKVMKGNMMTNTNKEILNAVYVHLESFATELGEADAAANTEEYLKYLAKELDEAADEIFKVIDSE